MKILPIVASASLAFLSSSVTAQDLVRSAVGTPTNDTTQSGCALPRPVTISSCWSCLQTLLADCDKNNPDTQRRIACYDAANNFFTWCLSRIPASNSATRGGVNRANDGSLEYDVRTGIQYEMFVPAGTTAADIAVFIRFFDGNENQNIQLQSTDFFVFEETDTENMFLIVVLDTGFNFSESNSIGIVSTVTSKTGNVLSGFAFAANIVDSYDLNNDGRFDQLDLIDAWQHLSEGTLDFSHVIRLQNALGK